jgi:murein DD-endopeptidase MepM/ murein hydrolase activator NlpD
MRNLIEITKKNEDPANGGGFRPAAFISFLITVRKGIIRNLRTIGLFLNTSHFLTVALFCCVTAGVFFNTIVPGTRISQTDSGTAIASIPPLPEAATFPEEILLPEPVYPEPTYHEIRGEILRGDTLSNSFKRYGVTEKNRLIIIRNLQGHINFRDLRPGDRYTLVTDEYDELVRCTYESGPLHVHMLSRLDDGTYQAEKLAIPLERRTVQVAGTINSSLFAAFAPFQEDSKLIYSFADIFASRIDFNTETRVGDRFCLVYDKFYKNGEFVGYGKIRVARYESREVGLLEGFYFSPDDNGVGSYFDSAGNELGASFIKSPVPMARISSTFSHNRLHPILKTVRPHLGVDLAAPTGTPVMAAADGKVQFVGRNGGYGKQIILDHGNGHSTYYGHLSGFSKGLSKGSRVRQKQIIGYVGSTGLSTGPHLDYRIKVNGAFKNPFAMKFKPRSELKGVALNRFQTQVQQLVHLEKTFDDPQIVHVKNVIFTSESEIIFL